MPQTTFPHIGVVRSPFTNPKGMPIQPVGAKGIEGEVEVFEQYAEGLADLDGFSHIYLLYHFHKARGVELKVVPYMDTVERGVFATRSPLRPAHIGLSVVELVKAEGNRLLIRDVDMLDGTPVLDIKPYLHQFDSRENACTGWMNSNEREIRERRSDDRFA